MSFLLLIFVYLFIATAAIGWLVVRIQRDSSAEDDIFAVRQMRHVGYCFVGFVSLALLMPERMTFLCILYALVCIAMATAKMPPVEPQSHRNRRPF